MKKDQNNIDFSEEVEDLLTTKSSWVVSWGILTLFTFLVICLGATFVIKYPDVAEVPIVLTTNPPPTNIVARATGKINLLVADNQEVTKGQHLAVIENPANYKDIAYLIENFDPLRQNILDNNYQAINLRNDLDIGEVQRSYLDFFQGLETYKMSKAFGSYAGQIKSLERQVELFNRLNSKLEIQKNLLHEELSLGKRAFRRDSILFEGKVAAEIEYDKSRSALLQSLRALEVAESNIINNSIRISETIGLINQLKSEHKSKEISHINDIKNLFETLEVDFLKWKQQYLITAPIAGKITLFKFWSNDQHINVGEELLTIAAKSDNVFGKILLPVENSANIELDQKVIIRLTQFPYDEFGSIDGLINSISNVHKDNSYSIQVRLPNGLLTSYNKTLPFRQEMQGKAQVVKADQRLIEIIFKRLRKFWGRA